MATPIAMPATKKYSIFSIEPDDLDIAKAWKAKCEQVIIKARFSMKDDKKTLDEIEEYAKQLKIN